MRVLRSIFKRKLRAFLTIFGITIGVLALVVMGSIAEKLQLLVDGGTDYYVDKVIVSAPSAMAGFSTEPLSTDVLAQIESVDGVARASGSVMMLLDTDTSSVNMGVPANINAGDFRDEGYESFESDVVEGRKLEKDDRGVVVVGSDLVQKLDAKVGEKVTIRNRQFEVIGILGKTLTAPDKAVQIALSDAQELLVADMPSAIRDTVDPAKLITSVAVYVDEGESPDELADVIQAEVPDIEAMGPAGFEKSVKEPLQIFTQIIYAIAAVSLLVGGLSVINTMTMSVAERTREIGVRKAIGASDFAIMHQFIDESATMGLIGGVLGLGLGALIAMAGNQAGAASATELFLLTPRLALGSVLFALVLGVLSGLYPAYHAARLNPVEALRYE
ncbi:MAG: ABC transporter permease [Coriobacteriia bacterium]|nr:ABC transporter permease [Coriobacteriia bacterium]MBN2823430.1 ABC transporter permease [Coriobacteriia bacterium]